MTGIGKKTTISSSSVDHHDVLNFDAARYGVAYSGALTNYISQIVSLHKAGHRHRQQSGESERLYRVFCCIGEGRAYQDSSELGQ